MNSSSETIVLSVVSGVLTSALIYLIVSIFEKILLPWYQSLIYRGIDVNGEWRSTSKNSKQTGIFKIEQKANKITGTVTFILEDSSPENEDIRIFDINGQISERFVTFILRHKDKQRLGISSYLLQIVNDGRKMEGCVTGYNIVKSNIVSDICELTRKEK